MLHQSILPDVSLALLGLHHADALLRVTDQNRAHLRQWLPWLDATRSVDDTRAFIRRTQRQFGENNGIQSVILVQDEIAGIIGHVRVDWPHRATSLGYWLAESFQGRGIMSEACRVYIRHAFSDMHLNRVEIRAAMANRRSRAVPERLGFQLEGTIRQAEWLYDHFEDHAVYGLLAAEWQG